VASSSSSLSLSLLLRPPSSTLFPYTTLFRSCVRELPLLHHRRPEPAAASTRVRGDAAAVGVPGAGVGGRAPGGGHHAVRAPAARDRKSTRLNSSHVKISYAVFCLKKKTTRPA